MLLSMILAHSRALTSAIISLRHERNLTAQEVVDWDHHREGQAEFWPSGDHSGVALVFGNQQAVTASEIFALDFLLDQLDGDTERSFLRIIMRWSFTVVRWWI